MIPVINSERARTDGDLSHEDDSDVSRSVTDIDHSHGEKLPKMWKTEIVLFIFIPTEKLLISLTINVFTSDPKNERGGTATKFQSINELWYAKNDRGRVS